MAQQKIVIVGANFAGLSAAAKLGKKADVVILDPSASFEWTPNIHELISGIKNHRSVAISSEKIATRLGHHFIQQRVEHIDAAGQGVQLEDGYTLRYDALLLACGHIAAGQAIPGAGEHSIGFRHVEQAKLVQQRIAEQLQSGKPMRISIVGGGFTGIEVLGELLRKYRDHPDLEINVIDAAPRLLPGLPAVIDKDIRSQCKSLPVKFYLKRKIQSITAKAVQLQGSSRIASDLVIMCAGTTLPPFVLQSGLTQNAAGIRVNDTLQCAKHPNIFVAGDIAATKPQLKKQASYAIDMGQNAGKNIGRYFRNKPLKPFAHGKKPVVLAFGDLNTYFIYGNTVFASPLLAPLKEAVYQFSMAQFSASLPLAQQGFGIASRYTRSIKSMLLPELLRLRFNNILTQSRRLQ